MCVFLISGSHVFAKERYAAFPTEKALKSNPESQLNVL